MRDKVLFDFVKVSISFFFFKLYVEGIKWFLDLAENVTFKAYNANARELSP